jgi:hypothetical protein
MDVHLLISNIKHWNNDFNVLNRTVVAQVVVLVLAVEWVMRIQMEIVILMIAVVLDQRRIIFLSKRIHAAVGTY